MKKLKMSQLKFVLKCLMFCYPERLQCFWHEKVTEVHHGN
jgi:hypothetical protein